MRYISPSTPFFTFAEYPLFFAVAFLIPFRAFNDTDIPCHSYVSSLKHEGG